MLLLAVVAHAQVPPDASAVPIASDPEPSPPALPASYAQGYAWAEVGPRTVGAISDVTVHPTEPGLWAVGADDGAVWLTVDAGRTWLEVLTPAGTSEPGQPEVAGEVEARLLEVAPDVDLPDASSYEDGGEVDAEELEQALEEAADAARDAAEQAMEEVRGEVEGERPWFLEGAAAAVRTRCWFTSAGLLVAARSDGLRVSEDLGSAWTQVLEEPVTALAELPDGRFVAGGPDGVWVSPTLARWSRLDGFASVRVHDLVEDDGLYAATDQGLWFTADLLVWRRLFAWLDEAFAVRPVGPGDGSRQPRPLVLGAADDLWLASEPVGSPASGVFGGQVPQALALVRRDGSLPAGPEPAGGLLLAASAAGPFESTDGGRSWTPVREGLPDDLETRALALDGETVLLASAGGLHELVPRPPSIDRPVELDEWVPLHALVDAGTRREELASRVGSRWAAALLPQVSLDGTWNQEVGDDWDADTWTIRSVDTWWQVRVALTWRPNRQVSSSGYYDAEELADRLDVLVIDDEVLLDDGVASGALVSKVNRGATLYRTEVADAITNLWTTRQRLVLEGALADEEDLLDRVSRALRVAELEARLDALTDGAVSSWKGGRP